MHASPTRWWREAVVYTVWLRSFADGNGDGIGDLPGLTARLDALSWLGVDTLWLTPIHPSPNADFGYDVRDYLTVAPEFGTLADFDALLTEAHRRGIRVVLDLVINHTSCHHPWFEASAPRTSPSHDWYYWRDQPNDWAAIFGGPAWAWHETVKQYCLHLFLPEQPDLNWENPAVRAALAEVARFWLDRGVDGFRFDALTVLKKAPGLPDAGPPAQPSPATAAPAPPYPAWGFELWHIASRRPNGAPTIDTRRFSEVCVRWWQSARAVGTLPATYLENHDLPRVVTAWADDGDPVAGRRAAKAFAAALLLQAGIILLYQGQELGLPNARLTSWAQVHDRASAASIAAWRAAGWSDEQILAELSRTGRDAVRTPYPWNAHLPHGGFTRGTPWTPLDPNHLPLAWQQQYDDPESVLHRTLIARRRQQAALL